MRTETVTAKSSAMSMDDNGQVRQYRSAASHTPEYLKLAGRAVIIEKRPFIRDCLTQCLQPISAENVSSFESIDAWLSATAETPDLIVLCSSGSERAEELQQVHQLASMANNSAPIMVMSDIADPDHIIAVLAEGAKGYLTTDIALEIAIEAMRFVCAGGVFVPATSLLAARSPSTAVAAKPAEDDVFTSRQIAVIKALRQGKANKIIAYELNMCESTVKVHVRNIMKKLKAKNRTHAAFIANEMLLHIDKN
jgi:DNA-binding NarL/FixJ family response regulator